MSLKNTIRALVEDQFEMSVKESLIGNGDPLFTLKAAINHIGKYNLSLSANARRRLAYWGKLVLPQQPIEIVGSMLDLRVYPFRDYRYWVTSLFDHDEIKIELKNRLQLWEAIKTNQVVYRQKKMKF